MLRVISWLVRSGALLLVGWDLFFRTSVSPGLRTAHIVVYSISFVMMVLWMISEIRGVEERWQPYLLGVVAVASGALCTFNQSSELVALALIAVMDACTAIRLLDGIVVTAAGLAATVIGGFVAGTDLGTLVGYPLLLLAGMLAGQNRRAYRIQAEQRHRMGIMDERTRIAREIHDVLAHSLGALGIQIQAARAVLTDHGDVDRALTILSTAQRMAADGLVETRRAVHALRVDPAPLDAELATIVETHRGRHHVPVTLRVEGEPIPLPPDAALALTRAAQEALVNAAKHAAGQAVAVVLHYDDHDVRLTVSNPLIDDSKAEFSTADSGYGLTGMRERLLLLRGTLTAGPADGRWTLTARVPT